MQLWMPFVLCLRFVCLHFDIIYLEKKEEL